MKHFTPHPGRRNVRVLLASLLSYLLLVGQFAPLALAANDSAMRAAEATGSAREAGAGEAQSLKSAAEPAPLAPLAPSITASKTDSFTDGMPADGKVDPGQEISYEVTVANSGDEATGVQFSDTIDANTTLVTGSVTMSPLARADSYNASEDTQLVVPAGTGVIANDSGLPTPTVAGVGSCADTEAPFTACATTAGGTVTVNADGSFTYDPLAGYEGSDTFTYTATNANSPDDTATVTITVGAVDDAPTAVNDSQTVAEDAAATTIDVQANDTDADGGTNTVDSVTQPTNGAVVITNAGADLTYEPNDDYCNNPPGTTLDTFTYTLNGGSTATVTVTVTCADDNPAAVNDSATVTEDSGANTVNVLANDTDPDGGTKSVASVTQPTNGTAAVTNAGADVSYTPNANYCNNPPGTTLDTFTYTLNGGSVGTVNVTVTCVDDNPTAVTDTPTVPEDSGATPVNVQANDTDPDGGTNTITSVTQPTNGSVVITNAGADLTYSPNANYCNNPPGTTPDTFTYTLSPGGSVGTVNVTVTCLDDAPTAVNDSPSVAEDSGATTINVLSNDTDIDGGPMSVASVTQPTSGTSAVTGGGTGVSYTPNANYNGSDSFTYTLNGGSTATVSVTVTEVNDAPTATNDAPGDVLEDSGTRVIAFSALTANDSTGPANESGQTLTVTNVTSPTGGTVGTNGTNVEFVPTANYCGAAGFTYTATDNGTTNGGADAKSSNATVTFNITCVNDEPSFTKGADQTVNEDAGAVTGTPNPWATAISAGPNEGTQTVSFVVTNDNNALFTVGGQPAVSPTGVLTFTPAANRNGVANVTVHITDNGGTANGGDDTSPTQTFVITVNAVNDPPTVPNKNYTAQANMKLVGLGGLLTGAADAADDGVNSCTSTTFTVDPASFSATSPAGGNITNVDTTNGTFDFDPPPGATGAVTFTYQIKDTGCPGPGVNSANVTVTVTVNGPVIWFVNPAVAGPGDGRLSNPFKFLTGNAGTGNDADDVDAAGHSIFLYAGTHPGGITLNNNESVIGQSATTAASFDALYSITPPAETIARPTLGGAKPNITTAPTSGTHGITLAQNNLLNSLAFATDGTSIRSTANVGAATIRDIAIANPGGGAGIDLTVGGTVEIVGTNTVSTASGRAVGISNVGIGANDATFSSITTTANPANAILLLNTGLAGTFSVTGTTSIGTAGGSGPTGNAISIDNHDGGVSFATVNINRRGSTGIFIANAAGTIGFGATTIPNPGNAGGHGIRIENSSSNVTFASATISNTNQTTNQVDGDNNGFPDNDADGDAIFLKNNTGSFTLNGGTLSSIDGDGIDIRTASNLVLNNVTINSVGVHVGSTANAGGIGGHGIFAWNLTGTNTITGSTITNWEANATNALRWWVQGSGTGTMTVKTTTFSNSETGSGAILYRGGGSSNTTLTVGGSVGEACNFTEVFGEAIGHAAGDNTGSTATANLNVKFNNFTGTPTGGQNTMSARNAFGGKAAVVIENNTFDGVAEHVLDTSGVIDIGADATDAGNSISFSIKNNVIKNVGTNAGDCDGAGGGTLPCQGRRGIDVFIDDNSNISGPILIEGNQITNVLRTGIIFDAGDAFAGSNYEAKIINNVVGTDAAPVGTYWVAPSVSNTGGEHGIRVELRSAAARTLNVLISGNSIRNGHGALAQGTGLNTAGLFVRAAQGGNVQATVTSNNIATNFSGCAAAPCFAPVEIRVETFDSTPLAPTACADINGNTLKGGTGRIYLNESVGTLNIEQASAAALAGANGIPAGNVLLGGSPNFGVACSSPPPAFQDSDETSELKETGWQAQANTVVNADAAEATSAAAPEAPAVETPAPARVWSDMPVIITRAPQSATEGEASEDEDKAEGEDEKKDDAAQDSDAKSKKKKPARRKPAGKQPEETTDAQSEVKKIAYFGPLGSAPANAPRAVRASYTKAEGGLTSERTATVVKTAAKPSKARARASALAVSGETVNVTIGSMPGGKTVKIRFRVTVNSPFNGATEEVSNQGTVTADGSISVQTDDPSVGTNGVGEADQTVTPVAAPVEISVRDSRATEPGPPTGSFTDMLFTVTLSRNPPSAVSVQFTTEDETPGAGKAVAGATDSDDYVTTSGTFTFQPGQRVMTIAVPVRHNTAAEPDETFLVKLSNPTNGVISDGTATGTITETPQPAGAILISELRTSGPDGTDDWFVELYNNSDAPVTVSTTDGSPGWGLFKKGTDCDATPVLVATIPATTTTIPARGHYLLTGTDNSLEDYGGTGAAVGDQTNLADLGADSNVGLFNTTDLANLSVLTRLDAVGFGINNQGNCKLLREGSNLGAASGSTLEHTFFRKLCDFQPGVGCLTPGTPKDTGNNSADFLFADTLGTEIVGTGYRLGAPGPENLDSPRKSDQIPALLLDASKAATAAPNRDRVLPGPGTPGTNGTLAFRRRVVNNTSQPVTRLRFRISELTTFPSPTGTADLRAITVSDIMVGGVNDPATCAAEGKTPTCTVTVKGATLETPPAQPGGGGLNATLTITLGTQLPVGESVNVNFMFAAEETGTYRFYFVVEALP